MVCVRYAHNPCKFFLFR